MELVVVVALLAIVASVACPLLGSTREEAEKTAAKATMSAIREAILGSPNMSGYLADMKYVPGFQTNGFRMHDLLNSSTYPSFTHFNRETEVGWCGPYLRNVQPVTNTNMTRAGRFPAACERRFAGDGTFLERGFFENASTSVYGSVDDEVAADPWGNPIVIQIPSNDFRYARLVSAGKNGVLETPRDVLTGGSVSQRGDDLVLFLNRSDKP